MTNRGLILLSGSAIVSLGVVLAAIPAAGATLPESDACQAINSGVLRPPGVSGTYTAGTEVFMTALTFTEGETITFSVNTVTNDGVGTATITDNAKVNTLFEVTVSDGATGSAQVPAGFAGLRVRNNGASSGAVTGFAVSCSAAVAPPDPPADDEEERADVATDPGQGTALTTVQSATQAVTNFSSFINSAVARRLSAGPAGLPTAVGSAEVETPVQLASLLPAGELMGGAMQAMNGGGFDRFAVAGIRLADNVVASADRPLGLWLNGAATFIDNDRAGGQYSGTVLSLAAGADYEIRPGLLAGLALGYERGEVDTAFNAGELIGNGLTLAPYAGWQPLPELTLDASLGVTLLDYSSERSGGTITSDFGGERWFAAVNATGSFRWDGLRLSPLAGVLWFRERQDDYTDSAGVSVDEQAITLGRLSGGLEAGYLFTLDEGLGLEPYLRVEGEWDVIRPDAVTLTTGDRFRPGSFGGSVAGGLTLIDAAGFTGNVEASYDGIGRDSYDSVTVQGTLRFSF